MRYPITTKVRNVLFKVVVAAVRVYYNVVFGTHIGKGARISLRANIDKTNPRGVYIGEYTALTFNSAIFSHDFVNSRHLDTRIGSYCFIGCGAVILPGVKVGDHCIISANSVVARDVPSNCVVIGNPARVVEKGIQTREWGIRIDSQPISGPASS